MGCCASNAAHMDAYARATLPECLNAMRLAYGKETRQTGYTDGHTCIVDSDKSRASEAGASLLYGEVLPEGVLKLMDEHHLRAGAGKVLFDLGMGTGKLVMQSFIQFTNLTRVVGVELSHSRFAIAEAAVLELARVMGWEVENHEPGSAVQVRTPPGCGGAPSRVLEVRQGNMWSTPSVGLADTLVLHTDLTEASLTHLRRLISKLKAGAHFVTYQDLSPYWPATSRPVFEQVAVNIEEADTFLTSWSSAKGYHLFCWEKIAHTPTSFTVDETDTKEVPTA